MVSEPEEKNKRRNRFETTDELAFQSLCDNAKLRMQTNEQTTKSGKKPWTSEYIMVIAHIHSATGYGWRWRKSRENGRRKKIYSAIEIVKLLSKCCSSCLFSSPPLSENWYYFRAIYLANDKSFSVSMVEFALFSFSLCLFRLNSAIFPSLHKHTQRQFLGRASSLQAISTINLTCQTDLERNECAKWKIC